MLINISIIPIVSSDTSNSKKIIFVDDDGGADYTNIQDAINYASIGDTVFVYNGIYYENLLIDKSLNLIGEDMNGTIIDGGKMPLENEKNMIHILADGVNISGFTIQNGNYSNENSIDICGGINVSSNNNKISGNEIKHIDGKDYDIWRRLYGIQIYKSENNIISDNIIKSIDGPCLQLWFSNNNKIYGNNMIDGGNNGINGYKSEHNNISGNIVNSGFENGIYFEHSSNNTYVSHRKFVMEKYYLSILEIRCS